MSGYSTREVARKLGISHVRLARYIEVGKVPMPPAVRIGKRVVHVWDDQDVERLRQLLPKITNGRTLRPFRTWERERATGKKPSAKRQSKKPQASAPVPNEQSHHKP